MQACFDLENLQYLQCQRVDGEVFAAFTRKGARSLSCSLSLQYSGLACAPQPAAALADCTNFELMMRLQNDGWEWKRLPNKKEDKLALKYEAGGAKIWYSQSVHILSPYLMSLVHANKLFEVGVTHIPYWVCSRSPAKIYKQILKGENSRPLLALDNGDNGHLEDEDMGANAPLEDEESGIDL